MIEIGSDLVVYLGILIIVAAIISYIAKKLGQPLILAYILAGLLLGVFFSGTIVGLDQIKTLSELGIAFLLFMVGLELSFTDLKKLAKSSLYIGLGQLLFTFGIGFTIVRLFNFSVVESLYIAVALTFSSTIIVMKILGEKNDVNTLYGKLSVGVLLIQDFVALMILVALAGLSTSQGFQASSLILAFGKGVGFIIATFLLSRFVLYKLFKSMAKSVELLFLGSIALCFLFIIIAESLGLTIEIGAFLAGLALANLPYKLEIGNKIRSLRDFFIVLFFIALGMQMALSLGIIPIFVAVILSLFVLIGNPLIVMIIMKFLGYKKKTGLFTGLTVAQISEFSLILVFLGNRLGHLSDGIVSLVTVVGVITITVSVYMMHHNQWIYNKLGKWLNMFEKTSLVKYIDERLHKDVLIGGGHYVLFGCHRLGYNIALMLKQMHKKLIVVDFDPDIVEKLNKQGIKCIYEDIGDYELYDELNLKNAEFVISTVEDKNDSINLTKRVKSLNKKIKVMVTAENWQNALDMYNAGADYVIVPHQLSGERVADILRLAVRDGKMISDIRKRHIDRLRQIVKLDR